MKTIHVPRRFTPDAWGGTETVVLELARRQQAAGDDPQIFCPDALASSREECVEGIPVRRFDYFYPYLGLSAEARAQLDRKGGNLFSMSLWKALRHEPAADLIHLHTGKRLGGIVRRVARARGIPYVVTVHGGLYDVPPGEQASQIAPTQRTVEWGQLLGWWVGSRKVIADADAVVCLGETEARALRRRFPHTRVEVIGNGVDAEQHAAGDGVGFRHRHGIADDAEVLLTVARIDAQKNQAALVEALAELVAAGRERLHLVLIGHVTDPDYREQLEAAIAALGLGQRVTLLPGVEPGSADLLGAYQAADIFVLPSKHEPFGIVVLEAWAARVPVVCAAVGGLRDLVEDGRTAVVAERPTGPGLAAAIDRMLDGSRLRDTLRDTAHRRCRQQYSWDHIAGEYADLYRDVRGGSPRRVSA